MMSKINIIVGFKQVRDRYVEKLQAEVQAKDHQIQNEIAAKEDLRRQLEVSENFLKAKELLI